MRRLIFWLVIVGVLGGLIWAAAGPLASYMKERNRVQYREAEVSRGRIVSVVNATGTVKPVRSVNVGSFVSGPILTIPDEVDHNAVVKKGSLLALIDPKIYQTNVDRDAATLATKEAEVLQVRANLKRAVNDEKRSQLLRAENKTFISDAEMDQFRYTREALAAQLIVAVAAVKQAKANLDFSQAQLDYTKIVAPEDGQIIDRKIDPGQTVAAQFQTPDLFVVAPDLRKEVRIFASVDEADIGLIQLAKRTNQPVHFTVDSHPDDLFPGEILQIRLSSTTTQNVVTYPVVVSAPNPDLKLLPGMTASISFQIREKKDVLRIPNAALRFFPQRDQVRSEDRHLLESRPQTPVDGEEQEPVRTAEERAELRRQRNRRHVWVQDGDGLRAVLVETGLSDNNNTELISGDLQPGQKLVTGIQPRN
jgi:HlyD family secretion protein